MKGDTLTRRRRATCPNRAQHTEGPEDYLAWQEWADKKSKTHVQRQCPGCDLWLLWEPKASNQKQKGGER